MCADAMTVCDFEYAPRGMTIRKLKLHCSSSCCIFSSLLEGKDREDEEDWMRSDGQDIVWGPAKLGTKSLRPELYGLCQVFMRVRER